MATENLETPKDSPPIRRQAIVVIHGQGRHRPMGTVRDFAKALWGFNEKLGSLDPDEKESGRDSWIVPDERTGMFDLHRITTPELDGRRTDFFELYYADLLVDTPIRNLWLWMQQVLSIDRRDVTTRMRWPWTLFWIVNLVVLALFITFVLRTPTLFEASWIAPLLATGAVAPLVAMAAAALVLVLPRLSRLFAWFARVPARLLIFVIFVAFVVIYWPPVPFEWPAMLRLLNPFEWHGLLHVVVLGVVAYLVNAAILPTFGGAASYLSAQAETVRSREAVRQRGVKLLRALHDDPNYDRIVVVAHSLGSVVAYDLLQIMWQAVGPTKDNRPTSEALTALRSVDAHATGLRDRPWSEGDVEEHQKLQWKAFEALRQEKAAPATPKKPAVIGGWKISDFVSLGSPLASAQFLITDSAEDFARLKEERLLPTAPPDSYEPGEGAVHTAVGQDYLHHAAVFSAVRWTNIYDTFNPVLVLWGDVISGPVAPQFGPAIRDVDARIGSFFSHGRYWIDGVGKRPPPNHIAELRNAVGMNRKSAGSQEAVAQQPG